MNLNVLEYYRVSFKSSENEKYFKNTIQNFGERGPKGYSRKLIFVNQEFGAAQAPQAEFEYAFCGNNEKCR